MFVLHFSLRAQIGQEFKRLLTNLVISVSRHFPSASLLMEGLFGGTTSSSTPLRSACRTGTSSTLLGTARLPDSTTHPAARLQTRWIRILRWEEKKKHEKKPDPSTWDAPIRFVPSQNCGSDEGEPPVEFTHRRCGVARCPRY